MSVNPIIVEQRFEAALDGLAYWSFRENIDEDFSMVLYSQFIPAFCLGMLND